MEDLNNITQKNTDNETIEEESTTRKHRYIIIVILACVVFGVIFYICQCHIDGQSLYFGNSNKKIIQGSPVVSVDRSVTEHGYTVTAKEVIADTHSIGILLQLSGKECFIQNAFFKKIAINIAGEKDSMTGTMRPVTCKEDGVFYLLSLKMDKDINNKDIVITLRDYGYSDNSNKFKCIQKGTWKLEWNLNYKDNATTISVHKNIKIYGGEAKFDLVRISPMSIIIDYSNKKDFDIYKTDGLVANDRIYVQFLNGNVMNSAYVEPSNFSYNDNQIVMNLDQLINLNDIESIKFADVYVQVHKNDHKIDVHEISSQDMNLSITIPKPVYDILDNPVYDEYYDEDFNAEAKKLSFSGEKDGIKMTLFEILAVKEDYTRSEAEEKNPMAFYLQKDGDYVYMLTFGEIVTQEQLNAFSSLLNTYLVNIRDRITIGINDL